MARLTTYVYCTPYAKGQIRSQYVNWRHDTTYTTFEQWAVGHAFYVRKDGKLDHRYRHCEPSWMARETK